MHDGCIFTIVSHKKSRRGIKYCCVDKKTKQIKLPEMIARRALSKGSVIGRSSVRLDRPKQPLRYNLARTNPPTVSHTRSHVSCTEPSSLGPDLRKSNLRASLSHGLVPNLNKTSTRYSSSLTKIENLIGSSKVRRNHPAVSTTAL